MRARWTSLTLVERIRVIRYVLPLVLIPIVLVYQLQVAFRLELAYGHPVHYAAEIGFYSLVGPVVLWLTLIWVERRLEEKEALERQVQARTRQLASLTAASSDAILSLDHGRRITSWNRGASQLFGYQADQIIGRPIDDLLPEAERLDDQSRRASGLQNMETTALTQNGHQIRVDLTQTQLEGINGESPVHLLIMRDVTVRAERAAILEEERRRISRDLHDSVAQTLYFLALKADMTREQVAERPEEAMENLKDIGQQTRRAIRDVRRAIFGLKPLDWSEGDFLASLEEFIVDFGREVNLQVNISLAVESSSIPARLEPTLFRLVQESLNNVAKHAQANQVDIHLELDQPRQNFLLTVRDDGVGYSPEDVSRGLGLDQMERRVTAIGGRFTITSRLGRGTKIQAEVPLRPSGENHDG